MFSLPLLNQRTLPLLLLLPLLLACELSEASSIVSVATAEELLAAIKDKGTHAISLQGRSGARNGSNGLPHQHGICT